MAKNASNITQAFISARSWQGKVAIETKALEHADKAIAALLDIVEDSTQPAKDRITASVHILDRAYGQVISRSVQASMIDSNSALSGHLGLPDLTSTSTRDLLLMASNRISQSIQDVTTESVQTTPGQDFEKGE
jgi:hypothetical protein